MLLRNIITVRLWLLRILIADGDAAEQRNDCVAVAVKVNGRRKLPTHKDNISNYRSSSIEKATDSELF